MTGKTASIVKQIKYSDKAEIFFYRDPNGQIPVKTFLVSLEDNEKNKFYTIFDYFARNGIIRNREKFRPIKGIENLFEFKIHGWRIYCFMLKGKSPKCIVLTHGGKKLPSKKLKQEINKTDNIKKDIILLYEQKRLEIDE